MILYRYKKYRHHQFTISTDWPGGIYGSPTINGSRAGGTIATCWATLMYFGYDAYVESTKKIITTARYIDSKLREMDGIFVFGTPATSVIAFGSKEFHIYRLSEALNAKGWNLNTLQFPSGVHICVTYMHTKPGIADEFLKDVKNELEIILKNPDVPVEGKVRIAKLIFKTKKNFFGKSSCMLHYILACNVWNESKHPRQKCSWRFYTMLFGCHVLHY